MSTKEDAQTTLRGMIDWVLDYLTQVREAAPKGNPARLVAEATECQYAEEKSGLPTCILVTYYYVL